MPKRLSPVGTRRQALDPACLDYTTTGHWKPNSNQGRKKERKEGGQNKGEVTLALTEEQHTQKNSKDRASERQCKAMAKSLALPFPSR